MSARQPIGIKDLFVDLWRKSLGSISLCIVFCCTVVYLATATASQLGFASKQVIYQTFGLSFCGIVSHHLYYQFLTAPFFHANLPHLVFNMLAVWMLGPAIEKVLGKTRYILLCAFAGLCGSLGYFAFSSGTGTVMVGYSGVIYGILVAQAIFFPDEQMMIFGLFPMKMKQAVILFAAVELYLSIFPEGGSIAHASHLFGALGAFIYLKGCQKVPGIYRESAIKKKADRGVEALRRAHIEKQIPKRL
jgi:membrane associated rhomboid family serine protease